MGQCLNMEHDLSNVEKWDAICIGAGLGSLAFAAQVVAKHKSAKILIIDKHSVPGGYATEFSRPKVGAVFDCSLHKLTGTRPGGHLHRLFHELGIVADLQLSHHTEFYEVCLPSGALPLGDSPERVKKTLEEKFPHELAGLQTFFHEVEIHGRDFYYQNQILDGSHDVDIANLRFANRKLKNISFADALKERFSDGYLKEILSALCSYVGGYPEELSYLNVLNIIYASLYKGNAYLDGRAQRLSDILAEKVVAAGGQVLLGVTATKIIPSETGAGNVVETLRGSFVSDQIYINAAPHFALTQLFDADQKMLVTLKKLEELKPTRATTTLYLTTDLDPAELGLASLETMVFACPQEECIAARSQYDAAHPDESVAEYAFWERSLMSVTNYHALSPAGGRVICINVLDVVSHWPTRKTKEYKEKKKRATALLLARLFAAKPGLEGHIVYSELSSPRTYERFTNNTDGAGYGVMVGSKGGSGGKFQNFPYKGIQFLSAWVAGSGYEAAFVHGEMKASSWGMETAVG